LKLVNEILILETKFQKTKFSLLNAQNHLIFNSIQYYNFNIKEALTKVNIQLHFLIPHSSHLTQPFDYLFFKIFKLNL
jgi:hypothetical protein